MDIIIVDQEEEIKADCILQYGSALRAGTVSERERAGGGKTMLLGTAAPSRENFEESVTDVLMSAMLFAAKQGYAALEVDADSFANARAPLAYVWNTLLDALAECGKAAKGRVPKVYLPVKTKGSGPLLARMEAAAPAKEVVALSYRIQSGEVEEKLKKRLGKDPGESSFRDLLNALINERPFKKSSEVYKACGLSKSTFSKSLNYTIDYKPSKSTVAAYAIGLKLGMEEAQALYHAAGYHLGNIDLTDRVVRFFLEEQIYDVMEVNSCLAVMGLPLLGEHPREEKVNITRE